MSMVFWIVVQGLTKELFFERKREVYTSFSSRLSAPNNKSFGNSWTSTFLDINFRVVLDFLSW